MEQGHPPFACGEFVAFCAFLALLAAVDPLGTFLSFVSPCASNVGFIETLMGVGCVLKLGI